MADFTSLSPEEQAKELCLRYRGHGYKHYKMSKFEEYDFYARNRSFLVSNRVITFTDLHGRLMALKPDVTLSIVKNATGGAGAVEKVYYTEKVYRAEKGEFREITQAGLECVGDLAPYDTAEVLLLALESLALTGAAYTLDLSHMGFLSGLLNAAALPEEDGKRLLDAISAKNVHQLRALCDAFGIGAALTERFVELTRLYGTLDGSLPVLRRLSVNRQTDAAVDELASLADVFRESAFDGRIHLDFSIVNDMDYYNGVMFRGYVEGVPQGVLAGGRYDSLLEKLGRRANALGFAVYLDLLEQLRPAGRQPDADVLLTYAPEVPVPAIVREVDRLRAAGQSVRVQKEDDGHIRAGRKLRLTGKDGVVCDCE